MNKYFNIKDKVYDITEKYPETIDIFVANGFEQLKKWCHDENHGKNNYLRNGLFNQKKVNIELFEQKLVEIIEQNRNLEDDTLNISKKTRKKEILRFKEYYPVPLEFHY